MIGFRWAASGLPVLWIAAAGAAFWAASRTAPPPAPPEPAPEPAGPAADPRIDRLVDILFPPPSSMGGGPLAPVNEVDARRLAEWMTGVESSRPTGRMASLYDLVDAAYEGLAGSPPPPAASGLPDRNWREFFARWAIWCEGYGWDRRLAVALEEVWLPGPAAADFALGVDDGLGRLAAMADVPVRPAGADAIEGWTRHRFDPSAERVLWPPVGGAGVSLVLVPTGEAVGAPVRIPLTSDWRAGAVPAWTAGETRLAGVVVLRWEWSR